MQDFTTLYSNHDCIFEAERYIQELGWWLVPVRGAGPSPKAPIFEGWPDYRPDEVALSEILRRNRHAGIGVHLGGSGLIDLEGDSEEGEAILDDLCRNIVFPCWRSHRSKHRLFQAHPGVEQTNIKTLGIEFRTGTNQSVLPPTRFHTTGTQYQWLVSPFEVKPPPLPDYVLNFYRDHAKDSKLSQRNGTSQKCKKRFPYRDDFDYLLRNFNLLEEIEAAGLELVCQRPDENGNVPCFVPAELRNGKQDDHPSGVFNVFNGTLRDFATGDNHLYFRVIEALTGEPWRDIYRRYDKSAGSVSGRPHSRRISLPTEPQEHEPNLNLESARRLLNDYLDEQLSRPVEPKRLHLIKGPCGLGKTYSICEKLGTKATKAIVLTLENELASHHLRVINEVGGGHARRMPVLRESPCPHPGEYEATVRRGYKPSAGFPCRTCRIGPRNCPYLLGFQDATDADVLCCAAIYHTHDGFYETYGNDHRPVVIFDESCIDLLLAPKSNSIRDWSAWSGLLEGWAHDRQQAEHANDLLTLVRWLQTVVTDFENDPTKSKFLPFLIPAALHRPGMKKSSSLDRWLNKASTEPSNRLVPNLYNEALYLLSEPSASILLERIERHDGEVILVRFRRRHPLPEDKEVFILDATANEDILRALAPDWDIQVWDCPPIEQKGTIVQIMDYDISRNRIRKEVARHRDSNPTWLVQVLDRILEKKRGPIISFKCVTDNPAQENDVIALLDHRSNLDASFNYPCRGYNIDADCLIVVGTPYKSEATIWELAMAVYGMDGLPSSDYRRYDQQVGDFVAGNMGYDEAHLKPIIDFLVSSDLSQAIGRVRPLQNECTIYVISNASIPDWEVQQFCASELFDLRTHLRQDASNAYERFVAATERLLLDQQWVKNSDVCASLSIPQRTGRNYWKRLKDDYQNQLIIEGPRIGRRR